MGAGASVWNSFGGTAGGTVVSNETVSFSLLVPAEAPLSLGVLRVFHAQGSFAPKIILLDPLPLHTTRLGINNTDQESALALSLPIAVDGEFIAHRPLYVRLELELGQSVAIEVMANRLGFPVDPRLRILQVDGRELVAVEDSVGAGVDVWTRFVAPVKGAYLVEVSDTQHSTDSNRRFRLRLGDFALEPRSWFPLAATRPRGESDPTMPTLPIVGPAQLRRLSLSNRPVVLRGFGRPMGTQDVVEFTAEKDQAFRVDIADRSLGSGGDFGARFEDQHGRILAETDFSKPELPTLTHQFAEAGAYRLIVEELSGGGGVGFDYAIVFRPFAADFRLHLAAHTVEATPGGTAELKLKIQRRNFDGPIKLQVDGLPSGCLLEGGEVATKGQEATLHWRVGEELKPGTTLGLRVSGSALSGGQRLVTWAGTRTALRKHWPDLNDPPPILDGLVWLLVKNPAPGPKAEGPPSR